MTLTENINADCNTNININVKWKVVCYVGSRHQCNGYISNLLPFDHKSNNIGLPPYQLLVNEIECRKKKSSKKSWAWENTELTTHVCRSQLFYKRSQQCLIIHYCTGLLFHIYVSDGISLLLLRNYLYYIGYVYYLLILPSAMDNCNSKLL